MNNLISVPLKWDELNINQKNFLILRCCFSHLKKSSTYEVLQILSISLTDKTHLYNLFDKTKFNDVKELDCPLFPGLFD